MPLVYDDVPGSWGGQSDGWPYIEDPDGAARRAVIANKLVPYGSYVTVGGHLRLETQEYVERVRAAMQPPTPAAEGEMDMTTKHQEGCSLAHVPNMLASCCCGLDTLPGEAVSGPYREGQWGVLRGGDKMENYISVTECVDELNRLTAAIEALAKRGEGDADFHTRFQRAANVMCATYRREVGKEMLLSVAELLAYDALKAVDALKAPTPAVEVTDERDAERYRWLRIAIRGDGPESKELMNLVDEDYQPESGAEFDAAIDAALTASRKGG